MYVRKKLYINSSNSQILIEALVKSECNFVASSALIDIVHTSTSTSG